MQVLVAIPVFNERRYVEKVLEKVRSFHRHVLVVDDGSTDGTAEYLATRRDIRLIRHAGNKGYGQSLIDAFGFAAEQAFDWVITMDCDEQHEPEMIPVFMQHIAHDDADIISGSRYMERRNDNDLPPGDRRAINATITTLLNDLYELNLTDAFCGFKAHRTSAMKRLHLDVPGYAFPMQLWPQAWFHGLRIREIPVRLIYNDPTRHFGGLLDDADRRLRHYLDVLKAEQLRLGLPESSARAAEALDAAQQASCCPCGCDR